MIWIGIENGFRKYGECGVLLSYLPDHECRYLKPYEKAYDLDKKTRLTDISGYFVSFGEMFFKDVPRDIIFPRLLNASSPIFVGIPKAPWKDDIVYGEFGILEEGEDIVELEMINLATGKPILNPKGKYTRIPSKFPNLFKLSEPNPRIIKFIYDKI